MNKIEIEKKYREELQFQIKHWKDRAMTSEKYLRLVLTQFPEVNAFISDKAKCDVKDSNIQCKNCDCWKKNQPKEETNEP